MGMVYQRGKVWWVKYYRNGIPMRESSGSEKETDAKNLLKQREGDIQRGLAISPRTAVRNLESAGVSRSAAMKLTGHKTESVYRRYAIVAESDLQEAARRLEAAGTIAPAGALALK